MKKSPGTSICGKLVAKNGQCLYACWKLLAILYSVKMSVIGWSSGVCTSATSTNMK